MPSVEDVGGQPVPGEDASTEIKVPKRSLRDIGRELGEALGAQIKENMIIPTVDEMSPAQRLMAKEMSEPKKLGSVLDDLMGPLTREALSPELTKTATEIALDVINAGPDLTLNMQQWSAVQRLVEQGVKAGFKAGRATR